MSLHCHNAAAQKRSVAVNALLAVRTAVIQEDVDIVAGDFNGASWRRQTGPECEIVREESGLAAKDQTRHQETWIHLSHESTPTVERERERRLSHQGRAAAVWRGL